jgi:hypothetical protein
MKTILVGLIWMLIGSVFAMSQDQPMTASGIAAYRAGDLSTAVKELEDVVSNDKGDRYAWVYLGASYLKLGDEKNAARAFKKSNLTFKNKPETLDKPLKTIRKPNPRYTEDARFLNVMGEVKVAVECKADGTIGFVFPFQKLPQGLTESSVAAAKSIKFEPGVKDGKAVDTVTVMVYTFTIY